MKHLIAALALVLTTPVLAGDLISRVEALEVQLQALQPGYCATDECNKLRTELKELEREHDERRAEACRNINTHFQRKVC